MFFKKIAILITAILAMACSKDRNASDLNITPLKDIYENDFKIGFCAGWVDQLNDPIIDVASNEFNVFTPGNPFKWSRLVNDQGEYNFSDADEMIAFAESKGMKIIGHTLIWHQQTPDWVFIDSTGALASKEEVMRRMEKHIKTVVSRYKGRIYAWDVVNEAVGHEGETKLRDSNYFKVFGNEEFIELAFKWAHEADPDAKLYYNDYHCYYSEKRKHIYNLIKGLLDKGVPIDGIGMQSHYNIYTPSDHELKETFDLFKKLGIEVNVSELDMGMYSFYDRTGNQFSESIPKAMLMAQAVRYARLFEIYKEYSDIIDRVTFWGTSDKLSWLNKRPFKERVDYPLLFDRENKKKPAYWAVANPDNWYRNRNE